VVSFNHVAEIYSKPECESEQLIVSILLTSHLQNSVWSHFGGKPASVVDSRKAHRGKAMHILHLTTTTTDLMLKIRLKQSFESGSVDEFS
jgi:hypothetical protein